MPDTTLLDTPRLHIRLLSMADFDFYFQLQSDPDTMRYIRPPEPEPEVVRKKIEELLQYADKYPGLGSMMVTWKETRQLMATCVLRHVEYNPENDLELGYIIAPEFQGRGVATEIARALAHYAFDHFQAPRVVAVTDPDNLVSQKVLSKCGFRLSGRRMIYEADCLEFTLQPGQFLAAQ